MATIGTGRHSGPQINTDPVVLGFLLRDGEYAHILAGEWRVDFDADTGWPTRMEIGATDDEGRELTVVGEASSRNWKGQGGDSLFRWRWNGLEGHGEDQSYFSYAVWDAN